LPQHPDILYTGGPGIEGRVPSAIVEIGALGGGDF
jgi:hypothetical protein